jgi:hypothetical protein
MPLPNQAVASAGIIAVSVAVAAAIALYESPELRRYADDLRRRIAVALHSLGDGINPAEHEQPLFNRPEDAEGFMASRRGEGAEPGVEETRRRQREELMYWNALHLEKQEKERGAAEEARREMGGSQRASSFDDFLRQDDSGPERGAFVFNTGAQIHDTDEEGLVRRRGRGVEGVRGLNASIYANPFADENHMDQVELIDAAATPDTLAPGEDEIMSDIYSASARVPSPRPLADSHVLSPPTLIDEVLTQTAHIETQPTLERELRADEFMTAGQDDRAEAYASIQAWAQGSNPDFYSPLPMSPAGTPAAPVSEPELISDGEMTPTDSASLAGSGIDVGHDGASSMDGETGHFYDVLSESDGMATPASWSEVGSVVSENEAPMHA